MSSFTTATFAIADALPAVPAFADAGHRAFPKAPSGFGLGLGLPTTILHTSIAKSESANTGLGIYIPDFDFLGHGGAWSGPANDDATTSVPVSSSSPASSDDRAGMMGTRIPRRRVPLLPSPTFTDSDYAPMRTPSPSLLQKKHITPSVLFAFTTPLVPELELLGSDYTSDGGSEGSSLKEEEAEAPFEFGVLSTTESISSGLNLLCLTDEELMRYIPSGIVDIHDDDSDSDNYHAQAVGLGLSLAELDGPELVLTLHEHGFRDTATITHDSHSNESSSNSASSSTTAVSAATTTTSSSALSSSVSTPSSPPPSFYQSLFTRTACPHSSPILLPHITSRYLVEGYMAHPRPRPASVRIGFSLEDGSPVVDTTVNNPAPGEFLSTSSIDEEEADPWPSLGFESPAFWERYLGVLYGQY